MEVFFMRKLSSKLGIVSVAFIFAFGISVLLYLFITEGDFLVSTNGVESLMTLASAFLGAGITIVGIYWTLQHESSSNRRRDMKQVISDKTEQRITHMPKITVFFEPLDHFPEAIERNGKFRVYSLGSFDLDAKPIMSKFRMIVRNHGFGYAAEFMTSFAFESSVNVLMQDTDFLFVDSDQSAEAYIEVHYLPLAPGEEAKVAFNMWYKDVFEYNYSYLKVFNLIGVSYSENGVQIETTTLDDFKGASGHQIFEPIGNYDATNTSELKLVRSYRGKIYYGNFELLDYPNTITRSIKPVLNSFYAKLTLQPTVVSPVDFQYVNESKGDPQYSFVQTLDFEDESKLIVTVVCTYDYLDSRILDIDCEIDHAQYKEPISHIEIWRTVYLIKHSINKGVSFL